MFIVHCKKALFSVLGFKYQASFTLSLPRVTNFKFPLQRNQEYYITKYEELGFSLLTQMVNEIILPILTTSLIHFSLKGWENVLFELGIERVNSL